MQAESIGPPRTGLSVSEAVNTTDRISAGIHRFYKYPARFSPSFASYFIERFTEPGDLVIDCFMGGGTSAVEALRLGRDFLGCDINSLAFFVTQAKTTRLSETDIEVIRDWGAALKDVVSARTPSHEVDQRGARLPWNLRNTLSNALLTLTTIKGANARNLARCSLLRTGQWALDCSEQHPTKQQFLSTHASHLDEMLKAATASLRPTVVEETALPRANLIHCPAGQLSKHTSVEVGNAKLVITSPPYPGVHVLYHRWQLHGRRETAAPYWLAGCQDGHAPSFYTLGPRRPRTWDRYMTGITESFRGVHSLLRKDALVVQLVAFSHPDEQLPLYRSAMADAGFQATTLDGLSEDAPIVRQVPNRKWYAELQGDTPASREYVLAYRPA